MTYIPNTNSSVSVAGTNDADLIKNSGSFVTIDGGRGNDSISNSGSFVTVDGDHGNDFIENNSPGAIIYGGSDDDTIDNSSTATLEGGNGNDSIKNGGNYVSISGGNDNDYIWNNVANNVTISSGNGNDTIVSDSGNNVSIDVGLDNDLVSLGGFGSGVTVRGSTDDDTLITDNYYGAIYQYVGGHDLIKNWNENGRVSLQADAYYTRDTVGGDVVLGLAGDNALTLESAAGKTINIVGGILSITSGTGESINNTVSNTVITGSAYGDTIINSGSSVMVSALGGDDSIATWSSGSKSVTLSAGAGNDTVNIIYANTVSVDTGLGKDSIWGNYNYGTIDAGDDDDTVTGNHHRGIIFGGAGNDSIDITNYWGNTIDGGTGSDYIALTGGSNHSINGGDGDDTISLGSSYGTARGGTGNDVIYGSTVTSCLYEYSFGDGNDTIYDWGSDDSLSVPENYSYRISGNNGIVSVKGSGNIILADAKDKTVTINGKEATYVVNEMITSQDVIQKFMLSLDKATVSNVTTMLDDAVKAASDSNYTKIQDVIDKIVDDCAAYNGNGTAFLKEKCDIDLTNEDTGAITGYDARISDTQLNASDVVPESGSIDKTFTGDSFSFDGLNVYLGKKVEDSAGFTHLYPVSYYDSSLDATKRYVWQGLYSVWIPAALNLIKKTYGENFSFNDQSSSTIENNTIYVTFYNDPDRSAVAGVSLLHSNQNVWQDSLGNIVGPLKLSINMAKFSSFEFDNPDGKRAPENRLHLDRVIAHEMTHAVMDANIKYATVMYTTDTKALPSFIKEGMAEITHGADDTRTSKIEDFANDYNALSNSLKVTLLSGNGGDTTRSPYVSGYIFLRYIAKQFSSYADDTANLFEDNIADEESLPEGLSQNGSLLKASTAFK